MKVAKTLRMRCLPVCDGCDAIIRVPTEGVIIKGGLYLASASRDGHPTGGIAGGHFDTGDQAPVEALCRDCFEKLLPWNREPVHSETP